MVAGVLLVTVDDSGVFPGASVPAGAANSLAQPEVLPLRRLGQNKRMGGFGSTYTACLQYPDKPGHAADSGVSLDHRHANLSYTGPSRGQKAVPRTPASAG